MWQRASLCSKQHALYAGATVLRLVPGIPVTYSVQSRSQFGVGVAPHSSRLVPDSDPILVSRSIARNPLGPLHDQFDLDIERLIEMRFYEFTTQ